MLLRQFDGRSFLLNIAFKLLPLDSGRDGQEEARLRTLLLQKLRRLEHVGQEKRDFLSAAARQEERTALAVRQTEESARRLGLHVGAHSVDEGIAEEGDVRSR